MKKFLFAILTLALVLCLLPAISLQADATEVTESVPVAKVYMDINKPAEGLSISDLMASVGEGATLESIRVYEAITGEEITEGAFQPKMTYWVHYTLKPAEGRKFAETVTLVVNNQNTTLTPESEDLLVYRYSFTTCQSVSAANVILPGLPTGIAPEEITPTVPENATYRVDSFTILDPANESAKVEALRWDGAYRLSVTLVPQEGYVFYSSLRVSCNGVQMETQLLNAGTAATCSLDFSMDVGEISVTSLPTAIKQDESVSTPKLTSPNKRISFGSIQWLDAERNPYPTHNSDHQSNYFRADNTYYLTFKLYSYGPVGQWETPNIVLNGHEGTVEVLDGQTAQVTIPYTPLRKVGIIHVTTQGIGLGKPLSGVSATADPDVVITDISFYDRDLGTYPTEGTFRSGTVYLVRFRVKAVEGYFIEGHNKVVVDGVEETGSRSGETLSFSVTLITYKQLTSGKVNVSGVGAGKSISKVKVDRASGSKFTLYSAKWYTTASSGSTFQKGHHYYLKLDLLANDGYCFAEDAKITVGGKKAYDISTGSYGRHLYCTVEYEYVTEVTKVSLPAMPKSITPGTTLPTNFKVSSSAKYTLTPLWMSMNTMETVTMANKNGCYILTYAVTAKDGCEFTEDTVFYVDGKKVKPVVLSAYYAQIMKPYNVGLTVLDRIDLTLPEPEHGAVPGEVTVPADAAYAVASVSWGVNTTGKLQDGGDTVTTFQNYKYHFLAVEMQTAPGYMFADKVSVFINGDKYTTLEDINLGVAYQTAVCFGKLGEIAKLTAPELHKDGLLLSWHSVPNADAYEVYRATSKSGKYTKVATVPETAWQDAAAAGKTYYYKVKAIFTPDTTKNSGYSNYVSIVYKCDAPVIAAVNGSTGKPVISWEKVSGAKKYTVYRATSETGKYTKLGTATKLTYTDSKAKTGTQYFYKVIANGSSSTYNSSYSNMVSCNVICATPSVTVKIDAATGKPSLSWKKIDAAAGYRILRQLPGEEDFTVIAEQTAVTFKDETAPIDTQCKYMVQTLGKTEALNGNPTKEITATSGIARPSLKTGLDAQGKPVITWEPIEGAVKYEIFRSTKSSKSYKLLVTVETPGYTDESVAPGKTYYYKVAAIGQVSKSAETSYVKLSGKCATPTIRVEAGDSGKPVISWEKISGAKKYTVYRATSETGKYTKLGTTKSLSYTDSKATVGKTYFYKLVANPSSSKYNSAYSNVSGCLTVCATPAVTVKNDAAIGKPVLSWKKVTGAVRYEIYLLGAEEYVPLGTVTGTSFRDDTCAPGEGRYYGVRAIAGSEAWNSQVSQPDLGRAACAQPKLKGTVGEAGKPELTWEAVEGATRYAIYRSTSKSSGYKAIDETESLTFTDISAKKGKTYYYKLVALCEDTESAQSAYVKIKSK